jgi:hypothetical protein
LKRYPRRLTGFVCLLTAFFILSHSPVLADEAAPRVLILPLTIHSEKDLAFLNRGFMDMMAARISQSAKAIRQDTPDPSKDPVQTARDLNADYVITGSLTLFGDSTSTDATLTEVESGDAALQFSQFGRSSGDVLVHINQFATQVSQYLAATTAPVHLMVPPVPSAQSPQPAVVAAPPAPAEPLPAAAPVVAAAAAVTPPAPPLEALWTSSPFKGTISALATGDVDGDGRVDIVLAHENRIVVEKRQGQRLDRMTAFDAGQRHTIIAVDAGDINGSGSAEIFVTRLDTHGKLDSVVLEWNGTGLQTIATDRNWYFRVIDDPEKGRILLGQRRGTPSANDTGGLYAHTHFLPGVFELTWTGKDYQAGRRFALPEEMTLYRFARGDIFNDGQVWTIAYSPGDELRIYDPAGSPQWAGEEPLGGNPLFLEATSSTDARTKDRTYLAQRCIVADLDGDGKVEIVTVHNRDAARGFLERLRKYTRGRVVALRWNKVNMETVWSGEEINGYISDFSLADLDGDGHPEAVYAMVASTGLTQATSSSIVIEQIGDLPEK